jgi:IS5 family transposase
LVLAIWARFLQNQPMSLGTASTRQRFDNPREILGDRLKEGSLYRLLADHGHEMFPDDYFADLYRDSAKGRPTVPARVLATTMLLQSFEGLSDREACDRLEVDLRWQAAAGVDAGYEAFDHTTLVGQRNRLRSSERPRRIFEDTRVVAKQTGAMKARARVLDSTPLYDSVATQDTVTQLRAVIRKLLSVLSKTAPALGARVRASLTRDDDYASFGKPPGDWDDPQAREALVDELVRDALAALTAIEGCDLDPLAREVAVLLALVAGQDVAEGDDGVFRIVRGVAKDRVISTVDTQARHGHKSKNRRFDGYKSHVSIDPDSELIDEVVATPANTPDREAVDDLLAPVAEEEDKPAVVGDSAYADGDTRARLGAKGYEVVAKVPPVRNPTGGFPKDRFVIDLEARTVTCPAEFTVAIRVRTNGGGTASFAPHCGPCALRENCTRSTRGRTVTIHPNEAILADARAEQTTPEWVERYREDRPVVERKIAHLVRRLWGGRKARCRGLERVATDLDTRAGAVNWARLAALGLTFRDGGWAFDTG